MVCNVGMPMLMCLNFRDPHQHLDGKKSHISIYLYIYVRACAHTHSSSAVPLTTSNPTVQHYHQTQIHYYQTQIHPDHPKKNTNKPRFIATAQGKFFSNYYDLTTPPHKANAIPSLVADLISLSMPTIVAVLGYTSAIGFILALSHDYILMRNDRGSITGMSLRKLEIRGREQANGGSWQ